MPHNLQYVIMSCPLVLLWPAVCFSVHSLLELVWRTPRPDGFSEAVHFLTPVIQEGIMMVKINRKHTKN